MKGSKGSSYGGKVLGISSPYSSNFKTMGYSGVSGKMPSYSLNNKLSSGYQSNGLGARLNSNEGRKYDVAQFDYFKDIFKKSDFKGDSDQYSSFGRKKDSELGACEICGAPVRKPMNLCIKCYLDSSSYKNSSFQSFNRNNSSL